MKNYWSVFGKYSIQVKANNKEEAKTAMIKKFNGYKDGQEKKDFIATKINGDFLIVEGVLR